MMIPSRPYPSRGQGTHNFWVNTKDPGLSYTCECERTKFAHPPDPPPTFGGLGRDVSLPLIQAIL
jgi:hypothetical protein